MLSHFNIFYNDIACLALEAEAVPFNCFCSCIHFHTKMSASSTSASASAVASLNYRHCRKRQILRILAVLGPKTTYIPRQV